MAQSYVFHVEAQIVQPEVGDPAWGRKMLAINGGATAVELHSINLACTCQAEVFFAITRHAALAGVGGAGVVTVTPALGDSAGAACPVSGYTEANNPVDGIVWPDAANYEPRRFKRRSSWSEDENRITLDGQRIVLRANQSLVIEVEQASGDQVKMDVVLVPTS